MSQIVTFPAPTLPTTPENKWRREQQTFWRLLPELLATRRGQYVAVHEGQVVEAGADKLEVAGRAYARFGYVPIYVSLVTEAPPVVCMPSPRLLSAEIK
jgi:hypothetical protein